MSTATSTGPAPETVTDARRPRWWRRRSRAAGRRAAGRSGDVDPAVEGSGPRRRHEKPRRWPWILGIVLVLALLVGAVYAVFLSPLLGVRQVTVTGAPDALAARIESAAGVPGGTPLARVDLDAVAAAVSSVPEVESVGVAREWPDTLAITVTPRLPVAVTSANGRLWLLDAAGDPFLAVDAPPPGVISVQLVAPGTGDPSTLAAIGVIQAFSESFRGQVADVRARTPYDVEITLTDGRTVIWGDAEQSATKMQILPAVLQQPGTTYNISDPSLVTVR